MKSTRDLSQGWEASAEEKGLGAVDSRSLELCKQGMLSMKRWEKQAEGRCSLTPSFAFSSHILFLLQQSSAHVHLHIYIAHSSLYMHVHMCMQTSTHKDTQMSQNWPGGGNFLCDYAIQRCSLGNAGRDKGELGGKLNTKCYRLSNNPTFPTFVFLTTLTLCVLPS